MTCATAVAVLLTLSASAQPAEPPWRALQSECNQAVVQNNLASAEAACRQAYRAAAGDDQGSAIITLELGTVLLVQGTLPEAESILRRSLSLVEKLAGPDSPELLPRLIILSTLYLQQDRTAPALKFMERALTIAGQNHIDPHTQATVLAQIASVNLHLDNLAEAERDLLRALDAVLKIADPSAGDPLRAELHANLGWIHLTRRRFPQAEEQLLLSIQIWRRHGPIGIQRTKAPLLSLTATHLAQNRLDAAAAALSQALAIPAGNYPAVEIQANELASRLAKALDKSGRKEEARLLKQKRTNISLSAAPPLSVDYSELRKHPAGR